MYCSKCKVEGTVGFTNYATIKTTAGNVKRYYYCRKCNADKMRKYYRSENGRESAYKYQEKYHKANPLRRPAWTAASTLPKRPCEVCRTDINVHKHHPDISKPFYIKYLCAPHHAETHRLIKINEKSVN